MRLEDQELISAYIDNELDDSQRKLVEDRLVEDDEFARAFANFDSQNNQIKDAFAEIDNKPLTPGLSALLEEAPVAQDKNNVIQPHKSVWKKLLPLAASVAIFSLSIIMILDQTDDPMVALNDALNSKLSGQSITLSEDERIFLSMSFDNNQGQWCREYFYESDSQSTHEIACRLGESWQTEISIDAPFPDASQYMPASGSSLRIEQWLDDNVTADILNKEQEASRINDL